MLLISVSADSIMVPSFSMHRFFSSGALDKWSRMISVLPDLSVFQILKLEILQALASQPTNDFVFQSAERERRLNGFEGILVHATRLIIGRFEGTGLSLREPIKRYPPGMFKQLPDAGWNILILCPTDHGFLEAFFHLRKH